jgi:hypothetical protein
MLDLACHEGFWRAQEGIQAGSIAKVQHAHH